MSSLIINHLPNVENYSYLELGVNDNNNFNNIKCKNKFSVDMNGKAMFTGTTDEYFHQLNENTNFDIIFIDANHDYDFVLRDFNNSVTRCKKWLLIHDLIPPSKKYIASKYCSDGYKILQYMLTEENFEIYPMHNNFGFTLIKIPARQINPPDLYKNITYKEFLKFITTDKTYSEEEVINILRKEHV